MEKQKENLFLKKFSLLNSQENSEEIYWSSSNSSDYEDTSINDTSKNHVLRTRVLKRKRKKKAPQNVSNLSITILDTSREIKKVNIEEKSPILTCTVRRKDNSPSPILNSSRSFCQTVSPILTSKNINLKSPILHLKTASPKSTLKVRKKLFNRDNLNQTRINNENKNSIQEVSNDDTIKKELEDENSQIISQSFKLDEVNEDNITCNGNTSNSKLDFVKRVRSFFDSNFSTQDTSSVSQNSISEISTPKSSTKTSEDLEILSCKSQILSNTRNNSAEMKQEIISANSSENSVYDFEKSSKKIRYKKDGHAYRLNKLIKKQKVSLSLWQHERYLAANSNFIIPKGEFDVFRIQKVDFKYGCNLLDCFDANNEKFLILINSSFVLENIDCEKILKLYEPYNVVQHTGDCKLIINVTKFECSTLTTK